MLTLVPLASGSEGNCYYIELAGVRLLLDLGISARALLSALSRLGVSPDSIGAVLVTHAHNDHTRGLFVAQRTVKAPVFLSSETAAQLAPVTQGVCFAPGDQFSVGSLHVQSFPTPHDCPGSVGFALRAPDGTAVGCATDLGHVPEHVFDALCGVQTVILEANHDPVLLRQGPYPAALKRRILSENGHLSNDDCALAARRLWQCGTRHFLLAHLSRQNNTPCLARGAVSRALAGTDAQITVAAPRLAPDVPPLAVMFPSPGGVACRK